MSARSHHRCRSLRKSERFVADWGDRQDRLERTDSRWDWQWASFSPVELVGRVLSIPETWWGYSGFQRDWHPGLIVDVTPDRRNVVVVSGTDILSRTGGHWDRYVVDPDLIVKDRGERGLSKPTAFSLHPLQMRLRRVRQLLPDRIIGRLPVELVADLYQRLRIDCLGSAA